MSSSSEETAPYAPYFPPARRSRAPPLLQLPPSSSTEGPREPSGLRDPFAKATNIRPRTARRLAPVAAAHPAPPARAHTPHPAPPARAITPPQAPPAQARVQPRSLESSSDSEEELPPIPPGHPFRQPPRRIRGARNHAELQLAHERRESRFDYQASRRRIRELIAEMDALEPQRAA